MTFCKFNEVRVFGPSAVPEKGGFNQKNILALK